MSVAAPAPARRRPAKPKPKPAPAQRSKATARGASATSFRPRRLSAGGLAWLLVLAALLGGIVALNVAALRASMDVSRLSASVQSIQQSNRGLSAQLALLTAPYRIDRRARQLGMVQQPPKAGDQLSLRPPRRRPVGTFAR